MRRLTFTLISAALVFGAGLTFVGAQQQGGSFVPGFNYVIAGFWNWTHPDSISALPVPFQAAGSDVTGIVSKVVDITDAAVKTLGLTSVQILPAPGPQKVHDIISFTAEFKYVGAYTNVTDNGLRLWYGSRYTGNAASGVLAATGLLDATANTTTRTTGTPTDTPESSNTAVVLANVLGSNYTAGNASNVLRVIVFYRTYTILP